MSIRRWMAKKLCPELAREADCREDVRVDPDVIRQWKHQINPNAIIWYDDVLKRPEPHVRISMTSPGHGDVYIDGVRQERILGFTLQVRVGKTNRLKIDYDSVTADISGDIEVVAEKDSPA